jgi:hypothetical protein
MPTINEIQNEIIQIKVSAQDEIRRKYLKAVADYT